MKSNRLRTWGAGVTALWRDRSLATRFLIVYLLLSVVTVVTLTWRSAAQVSRALEEEFEHELELQAFIIASALRSDMEDMMEERRSPADVLALLKQFARDTDSRITLLDRGLEVVFSTDPVVPPHKEHRHPEVVAALEGREQHDIRLDEWTDEKRLFVAAPVREEQHIIGLVQLSIPWSRVQAQIVRQWTTFVLTGFLAIIANVIVSLWLAYGVAHPLRQLTAAARRIAAGHLDQRIPVTSRDEVGTLAAAFNEMAEQLQEMIHKQHLFIANASHELRSPLTSITLRAEALLENPGMPPEMHRRFLQEVNREADRLRRLAERLLDLSRLQVRPESPVFQVVHLPPILDDALEMMIPRATRAGVQIQRAIPSHLPPVHGSPDDLSEVVVNLLDNALKHTPAGGKVTLGAQTRNDHVVITVSDTGEGIPAADLAHIFEPFYRVDKARSRRAGGSGLGLTIVKEIVEAHEGTVDVTSQVGVGTTFYVTLPRYRADTATAPVSPSQDDGGNPDAVQRPEP